MKRQFRRILLAGAVSLAPFTSVWPATGGAVAKPLQPAAQSQKSGEAESDASGIVIVAYGHPIEQPQVGAAAATPGGDVAMLEELLRNGQIVGLRQTTNGSYGAMLGYFSEMNLYFAALTQQNKLWRVFKTLDEQRAESAYREFANTTGALASTELRRLRLESDKAVADRLIASHKARADQLQADLEYGRMQQTRATDYQIQQQEAIRALRAEQSAAQTRLLVLRQRVETLQTQSDSDAASSGL